MISTRILLVAIVSAGIWHVAQGTIALREAPVGRPVSREIARPGKAAPNATFHLDARGRLWVGRRTEDGGRPRFKSRGEPRDGDVITIDGSKGEGGGQVLRTSLALSLATGTPFRIERIRAARAKPGLLRQHLTAVQAAAAVGRARVEGDAIGSLALTFTPQAVQAGDYAFSVGTAGSATLVLQTILPPLLRAAGRTTVTLEGGTHNPSAPPFDYLQRVFLPIVSRLGPRVDATLERRGFYPAGGGRFVVTIDPASIAPLQLLERGDVVGRRVTALVAHLPRTIGDREVATALGFLNWPHEAARVESVANSPGPGNVVFVELESEHVTEICTGFGEVGKSAEKVAEEPVTEMQRYLAAGVPVGCHLADQLMTLLAVGPGGSFRTLTLSRHALTNADVVHQFGGVRVTITSESRDVVRVDVGN